MFTSFFLELRAAKVPASLREYLTLMQAMKEGVAGYDIDDFYFLSRAALVKDERHLDRFDRVFGHCFKGLETPTDPMTELPEEWLKKLAERYLTEEEKQQIEAMGGWEKLMETLRQGLVEQKGRHQGGSKWIGTAGTSPYGAHGYNPEGVRIGQHEGKNRRAVKIWDRREFRNLDDTIELGTRHIKIALRRLRQFARDGADFELDLPDTIKSTANNAGWLDLKLVPERHNAVKLLLFLDVGGSMEDHVRVCEELFSAARGEFKNLVHFYFHNCLYESVWKSSAPPPCRATLNDGNPAHLRPAPQGRDGRRRQHEPLRDRPPRRQRRALERRGRRGLDAAPARPLSASGLAQPGAGEILGRHHQHRHDPRPSGGPDVPADPRRDRPGDAAVDTVASCVPRGTNE